MIPEVGQHVKCVMKNSVVAEGIVEEWFATYVKLKSLDGKSYLIIHHPAEDIMLTKVVLEKIVEHSLEPEPMPTPQTVVVAETVHLKKAKQRDPLEELALDAMSKAELQVELAKQEREIVAAKLRDHHIGDVKKVKYGQPGLYKKPSTK